MENKASDALYEAFCELNKELVVKYGVPERVPFDCAFKKRINDLYKFVGFNKTPYTDR